jgi:hypothetical protein
MPLWIVLWIVGGTRPENGGIVGDIAGDDEKVSGLLRLSRGKTLSQGCGEKLVAR